MPLNAHLLDHLLHRSHRTGAALQATWPAGTRLLDTPTGRIRVLDTGTRGPAVVMVPDGPCVIEHLIPLISRLAPHFRVICFDMPGFGFSYPGPRYDHSLRAGGTTVLDVLDGLGLERAALAFSCANGFYGLRAAQQAPERISHLALAQTPSLGEMHLWVRRVIPRPLRVPVLGQLIVRGMQGQLAARWYRGALPRGTDLHPYNQPSTHALATGGCFSLAGVVQGLSTENHQTAFAGLAVPTTLVWGALDRSHRPTDPTSLREHAPQADFVSFADCGHFPNLEQPARFADLLRAKLL